MQSYSTIIGVIELRLSGIGDTAPQKHVMVSETVLSHSS